MTNDPSDTPLYIIECPSVAQVKAVRRSGDSNGFRAMCGISTREKALQRPGAISDGIMRQLRHRVEGEE